MNSRADGGIISLFPPLPLLLFLNFILFFIYFYLLFIFLFVFNKLLGSHGHRLFTGSCLPLRKINGKPRVAQKVFLSPIFSPLSPPLSHYLTHQYRYKVLATLPNWLHRFYTDFSLTFPNYNIHQPHKNQQINNSTKKLTKIIQKDETQKYQDNKQKALDFINQYIPNKSPFIYGELINNRMQLVKNGTLVSYFTR